MFQSTSNRRDFLRSAAAMAAAGAATPYCFTAEQARAVESQSPNERPHVAVCGMGTRGSYLAQLAANFGEIVAVCDVDLQRAEKAKVQWDGKPAVYQDYRKLMERKDVDVVINATPDHWHTAINIAACKTGRDVYTEKPLTLTIDEGKIFRRVVRETGRVVQVGTQQRSERPFHRAVELIRAGRLGKLKHVTVTLPFWSTKGGPFPTRPVPSHLDWDLFQGQAPLREYCPERVHFNFRWWSEYGGGIVTDWGQHHMDIAHWGMGVENSGPLSIEGTAIFPNEGKPKDQAQKCYNNPDRFVVKMMYPGDIELLFFVAADKKNDRDITDEEEARLFNSVQSKVRRQKRNGIMFTGESGRIFVNRRNVYGKPVEDLQHNPLPSGMEPLAADASLHDDTLAHMANFFDCIKTRRKPASDIETQHRSVTACHLSNIAILAKRKIMWDSRTEQIVGDDEANSWLHRPQPEPYTIKG